MNNLGECAIIALNLDEDKWHVIHMILIAYMGTPVQAVEV